MELKELSFDCLEKNYSVLIFASMIRTEAYNKIEYVVCCVGAFAQQHRLTNAQAYAYLRRFSGIDFLIDFYEAEHTLSIEDAVEDITAICQREGGKI